MVLSVSSASTTVEELISVIQALLLGDPDWHEMGAAPRTIRALSFSGHTYLPEGPRNGLLLSTIGMHVECFAHLLFRVSPVYPIVHPPLEHPEHPEGPGLDPPLDVEVRAVLPSLALASS